MNNIEKSELLREIEELMSYDGNSSFINKEYLRYLEIEDLISIRDELLRKKIYLKQETIEWFDELYEKTKKD
ncbi:hypothetical protein [Arcobacter sp. FWKO B]|uniref:hypothetical protein n=1 Tax=Arcobacter sp. FWKO B TaxID=2593672 RepID=UPI0018A5D365|nr:hypothetical protein [Arcobacter sp. FWKO B]QOG11356.1 hypothetical protein FWKOB_01000 [Arcobacter sp. FWKO B]